MPIYIYWIKGHPGNTSRGLLAKEEDFQSIRLPVLSYGFEKIPKSYIKRKIREETFQK